MVFYSSVGERKGKRNTKYHTHLLMVFCVSKENQKGKKWSGWRQVFKKASKVRWLYKDWTSVWYSDPGSLDLTCIQHASTTASSSAQFIKEWLLNSQTNKAMQISAALRAETMNQPPVTLQNQPFLLPAAAGCLNCLVPSWYKSCCVLFKEHD